MQLPTFCIAEHITMLRYHAETDLSTMQKLLPEKRMLYQPNLPKAAGSDFLAARIKQLRPLAHVFGHTHFPWDAMIDGTRYCQWPLGYPRERRYSSFQPPPFFLFPLGHQICRITISGKQVAG